MHGTMSLKSVTELGHLLTRFGVTYPEVSSKVFHDSFCQLASSVSLPWVIYFVAFYLYVVSSFACIPVICPKLVLFLTPLQFVHLFCNLSQLYPAVLLISAAVILLASLALTVQVSLPCDTYQVRYKFSTFVFDLLMMSTWCSKHVEAWNKLIVKQKFCASSWLITDIKKSIP